MRWKQFFTRVESIEPEKARAMLKDRPVGDITVLDVRQPAEYERGHISGAKLIPLPELDSRLAELDSSRETLVYCASGGRSRVGAQILAGRGFERAMNLAGGFKAWQGRTAFGPPDSGLQYFSGQEGLPDILITAYGLEAALRRFYEARQSQVSRRETRDLLAKLGSIEEKHEQAIFDLYLRQIGADQDRSSFEREIVLPAMEGGLSDEEYLERFQPDLDSEADVLELAMSIEGQALDLYLRAAEQAGNRGGGDFLRDLADEEREHLNQLGQLLDRVSTERR